MPNPTAAMLVIGDEILSGRTRDSNAHHLARELTEMGVDLREIRVVPDQRDEIITALNALRARMDYVFTSGGIGPTHDDITADAVAAAFGAPIAVRADARAILEAFYKPSEINQARLRMARIPEGATLILNPVSHAPGFHIGGVFVMAGVPAVFEAMLEKVKPELSCGAPMLSHSLRAQVRESDIAASLGDIAAARPSVSVGCYPFSSGPLSSAPLSRSVSGATIVVRATDPAALTEAAGAVRALLRDLGIGNVRETPPRS